MGDLHVPAQEHGRGGGVPARRCTRRTRPAFLTSDVYRLSASATGTGWTAKLLNALTAVKFGESINVPVYVTKATSAASAARSR